MDKVTDSDINISIEFLKEHKDITLMSNGIPVAKIDSAYMANVFQELKQLRAENATLQDVCKIRGNAVEHLQGENARLREALTEISKDTMRVGFFNPYTKGAMIARAALEKHVREIDHINEISTPSTQAENVSKNSGHK